MTQEPETSEPFQEDPFSIDIDLRHPTFDPLKIAEVLALEPTYCWKRGDQFGGVVKTSAEWYGRLRKGSGGTEYEAALADVVSFLAMNDRFFDEFRKGGGEIQMVFNHVAVEEPKGIAFELELSPVFLENLSRRGIRLRVRAWSDNPSWRLKEKRA